MAIKDYWKKENKPHQAVVAFLPVGIGLSITILLFVLKEVVDPREILKRVYDNVMHGNVLDGILQCMTILFIIIFDLLWAFNSTSETNRFQDWIKSDRPSSISLFIFFFFGVCIGATLAASLATVLDINFFLIWFSIYSLIDYVMLVLRLHAFKAVFASNRQALVETYREIEETRNLLEMARMKPFFEAHMCLENYYFKERNSERMLIQFFGMVVLALLANYRQPIIDFLSSTLLTGYEVRALPALILTDGLFYSVMLMLVIATELRIYRWRRKVALKLELCDQDYARAVRRGA